MKNTMHTIWTKLLSLTEKCDSVISAIHANDCDSKAVTIGYRLTIEWRSGTTQQRNEYPRIAFRRS